MKQLQNFNEVYLALVGKILGGYWYGIGQWDSEGSPGQVAFDHELVMEREEEHHDIAGFYHTHPISLAFPSHTDYQTMGAWTVCFGKPLVCCIRGTNGLKAHWFLDDETKHITSWVRRFGSIYIGRVPRKVRKFIVAKKSAKRLRAIKSMLQ